MNKYKSLHGVVYDAMVANNISSGQSNDVV